MCALPGTEYISALCLCKAAACTCKLEYSLSTWVYLNRGVPKLSPYGSAAVCMRSKARLITHVSLRLARLPRTANSLGAQRSRCLRYTRAVVPVRSFSRTLRSQKTQYFSRDPKRRYPAVVRACVCKTQVIQIGLRISNDCHRHDIASCQAIESPSRWQTGRKCCQFNWRAATIHSVVVLNLKRQRNCDRCGVTSQNRC